MSGPAFLKRQKELKRQEKAQEKAARREERKKDKDKGGRVAEGEDPDIAHIVPGPQPIPEE